MYRENANRFIEKPAIFCLPKNSGLNDYIRGLLPQIGLNVDWEQLRAEPDVLQGGIAYRLLRGEDIPQFVDMWCQTGQNAYGLIGDDLFDKYQTRAEAGLGRIISQGELFAGPCAGVSAAARRLIVPDRPTSSTIRALNTYDWYDEQALYKRPALALLGRGEIKDGDKVAVNQKYLYTSLDYLAARYPETSLRFSVFAGGTEEAVKRNLADCCVDIVYSGKSMRESRMEVLDIVRFSDIVLIGRNPSVLGEAMAADYTRIKERAANPTDSYTSKLLADPKKARDKFAAEAMEVFAALEGAGKLSGEIPDLLYSLNVLMVQREVTPQEIAQAIRERFK